MRHLLCLGTSLLLMAAPGSLSAETARVRGGEHADFTRIVIEMSPGIAWRLGRTEAGYAFQPGPAVTGFDLSRAFDKIPKTRLTSLTDDGNAGGLGMILPCACHALAVEVRSGVIAIDFRNGPAPAGSTFEKPVAAKEEVEPQTRETPVSDHEAPAEGGGIATQRRDVAHYDWLVIAGIRHTPTPSVRAEAASDEADHMLDPLRDALLRQISKGIAEGVIQPGSVAQLPDAAPEQVTEGPGLRISAGEMPGLRAGTDKSPGPNLTADGKPCLPDRLTDVSTWLSTDQALASLGTVRADLLSEFDAPVTANILKAARTHIALGFGAEARQILSLLPAENAAQHSELRDLSYLIDLEPAPVGAFSGMEACDTPAALWATLANAVADRDGPESGPNAAAVSRSFSALSLDLRRHLGPTLVAWFLARGDEATARRLRDAILRAPGDPGQRVSLMDAGIQLTAGEAAEATTIAEEVMADPGVNAAEAAIMIAESAFAGDRQVPPELPAQLAALAAELRGGEGYARIIRAEILARAMTADFVAAFDLLATAPHAKADLWEIAATKAPEDILLQEAVGTPSGETSREVNMQVAVRLLDLGFGKEALAWLGPVSRMETDEERLLGAGAALSFRDARQAVRLLAGVSGSEADALRARAAIQLGNASAAAAILLAKGDEKAALRAGFWAGDWTYVALSDAAGLSPAAALLAESDSAAPEEGLLARSTRLAAESEAARETINGLMQALPEQFP